MKDGGRSILQIYNHSDLDTFNWLINGEKFREVGAPPRWLLMWCQIVLKSVPEIKKTFHESITSKLVEGLKSGGWKNDGAFESDIEL